MPEWSKAVESAASEADSSSTRGSGWEYRATQSRQANPEEAQAPSWGTAQAAL